MNEFPRPSLWTAREGWSVRKHPCDEHSQSRLSEPSAAHKFQLNELGQQTGEKVANVEWRTRTNIAGPQVGPSEPPECGCDGEE